MKADEYNLDRIARNDLRAHHVTELVRRFQIAEGMEADGMAGPRTIAMLELLAGREPGYTEEQTDAALPALEVGHLGWLVGAGVEHVPMDPSWHYARLMGDRSEPVAIVAHYSATDHGSARNMAKRRAVKRAPTDRPASWHVSIEGDGSIIQMASLKVGTWHAGGPTAKPIPGEGPANHCAVGIELIGDGSAFPRAQEIAACRVWRAIVRAYGIPRHLAMVAHSALDPTRKRDPGELWMKTYAPRVLAAAGL